MADLKDEDESTAAIAVSPGADGQMVITISGELDMSNAGDTREAIEHALGERPGTVIIDLTDLRFMDSSGIAILLSVALSVEKLQLRRPSSIVRRVIEAAGLGDVLPIEP